MHKLLNYYDFPRCGGKIFYKCIQIRCGHDNEEKLLSSVHSLQT